MTDKTDTGLADKVRQFRSNAPKLDMAALARVKQVADDTLFQTDGGGQLLSAASPAGGILAPPPPAPAAKQHVARNAGALSTAARAGSAATLTQPATAAADTEGAGSRIAVTLRMDADLHLELKYAALKTRMSLSDFVSQA